ncbi:MAG: hypothetical protein VB039_05295 [Oscillospiraceae bacterium]|nr:hypothetical protein [Oscillospiraceae bacterium]
MKKICSVILCLCAVFSIVACGKAKFDLPAYKQSAAVVVSEIMDNAVSVGNIAQYESNYVEAYRKISGNRPGAEDAFNKAIKWFEKEQSLTWDNVVAKNDTLTSDYSAFVALDAASSDEASDIQGKVKILYETYFSLYNSIELAAVSDWSEKILSMYEDAKLLQSIYLPEYLDPIE